MLFCLILGFFRYTYTFWGVVKGVFMVLSLVVAFINHSLGPGEALKG